MTAYYGLIYMKTDLIPELSEHLFYFMNTGDRERKGW